jgi:hypothetical protein
MDPDAGLHNPFAGVADGYFAWRVLEMVVDKVQRDVMENPKLLESKDGNPKTKCLTVNLIDYGNSCGYNEEVSKVLFLREKRKNSSARTSCAISE